MRTGLTAVSTKRGARVELGRMANAWISTAGVSERPSGVMLRDGAEEGESSSFIARSGYNFCTWKSKSKGITFRQKVPSRS